MAYTEIDDPSAYFQTAIYTGNGGTQSITFAGNSDLQPDFLWVKGRSVGEGHYIQDSVRGVTKHLHTQNTDVEATDTGVVTALNSDGFALGNEGDVNSNNGTFVAWGWKTGTSFTNDASSTSVGSVDTAGSVNTTAGFSIMKYTGVSGQQTIAHGLGAVPRMIIVKNLDSTETWRVYHHFNTAAKYMKLNTTAAVISDTGSFSNVTPTSSVITMGGDDGTMHANEEMIAYIFAEKKGYSKFGSYLGNGNTNGTFVYLGFKPAFLMVKKTSGTGIWGMYDNKRIGFNEAQGVQHVQRANASAATSADGGDAGGFGGIDFLSNGFKCKLSDANMGADGATYIFMAFAENPVVTSTGVPATAS